MDSRVHENEEGRPRGRFRMGPRIREDTGWGVFTPILTFPPQGGRELGEGDGCRRARGHGMGSDEA